jgi:hypothetical protein
MCNFVHKSVKNARFSPRKVQKRGFFAGGRGDFLAGQKRGFLGSRGCRAGHVARRAFSLDASLIEFVTLMIAANNKIRTVFYICINVLLIDSWIKSTVGRGVLRTHRAQMDIMVRYRHSELAERPEAWFIFNYILIITTLVIYDWVPRSVNDRVVLMPALPFVRSMGPKTRNVYSPSARKYAKTTIFGPTDIACLPGPKIHEILEISLML